MSVPFVIDNDQTKLADVLNGLLSVTQGKPFDVATAYFSISGYRLIAERLRQVGAFRLLIGSDPRTGADVGLRPNDRKAWRARLKGDLEAEPFAPETLRLVEDLISFLRADKVQIRLYERGFQHAKCYLFHQDIVGPQNLNDRLRPFAAIVGSSNFTGPGLTTNRELNVAHRVFTSDDEATDREAARAVEYLVDSRADRETMLDPSGVEVPASARRIIKSEVGARAMSDLTHWFEGQWADSVDFKTDLIELLDASKFGTTEYTPYQVYMKALYEYFKDELGEDPLVLGRSAVSLAEFQEDAVKKARRILSRYDGVLIADSVGLGKTWIGKRLLEDFAYHRRQKAVLICSASLMDMWRRELASATIAAQLLGMEEMGRETFDPRPYSDADVILIDESHNFRNDKSNRYDAITRLIAMNRGRGRDGERKKIILLSATPINNDLYDLQSQIQLFTQFEPDYFADIGIADLRAYFRRGRKLVRRDEATAGMVLFNLLEEIVVRNTRPYIKVAYPNATVDGKPVRFPERKMRTVNYSLGDTYAGLYDEIVHAIEGLSLAPYTLESYRKPETIVDRQEHEWETGREQALIGIFKSRFLKRLESSVEAFRLSLHWALTFEETYLDYLLDGRVVSCTNFRRAMRFVEQEGEDEPGSAADRLDAQAEARTYIESLPTVDLNQFDLRKLRHEVETDVKLLRGLYDRTRPLVATDGKLEVLKSLLAGELKDGKVLVFSSFKDTSRYLHRRLTEDTAWLERAGNPRVRRIDSGNHPDERGHILGSFAPVANQRPLTPKSDQIDILISTDVLSEGQNLQDCGVVVNYDLTWNPIRLVQRNGRIDRIGSPHETIAIYNMFPEDELENLLQLVARLMERISQIDETGLLDASVLGEVVHPRTFNTIRRFRDEDGTALNEEEERAELAGPELLLKQLKEVLSREGSDSIAELPMGIHSGLRRLRSNGVFFYFQAPRRDGQGKRHYWEFIDATTHEVNDNRFEIAQLIACQPDEPRFIGEHDLFALQDKVVEHLLSTERDRDALSAAPLAVDPTQRAVTERIKAAIQARTVERDPAKVAIRFLARPSGRFAVLRLKAAYEEWAQTNDDGALLNAILELAADFGKDAAAGPSHDPSLLRREELTLVCFDHVSS